MGLSNITPGHLIQWTQAIHKHIGESLMRTCNRKSGEYAAEPVLRWHFGAETQFIAFLATSSCTDPDLLARARHTIKQSGMGDQSASDFIQVLKKIDNDKQFTIHPCLKPYIDYSSSGSHTTLLLNKLTTAYNLGQLNK